MTPDDTGHGLERGDAWSLVKILGEIVYVNGLPLSGRQVELIADSLKRYGVMTLGVDAEAGRAARAEEEVAELRRAVVFLALPAEVIVAVHSDGKYVTPETIQAFRDALTAARAALAPRPEAGATVGEGQS